MREGVSARVSFTGVRGLYQSEDTDVKFMLELTLPQMPPRNCKFYMLNRHCRFLHKCKCELLVLQCVYDQMSCMLSVLS